MKPEFSQATSASILVVDDVALNLQLMSKALRRMGFTVRVADSGVAALESARAMPPDLILLDVRMPGMDGYQVCAAFKADDRLKPIPVMFVSAAGDLDDRLEGFQVGGVDYLAKPFGMEEFEARVHMHIEHHLVRQKLARQNALLSGEVKETLQRLEDTNSRLLALDRAKTAFLHLISQAVRTDLSVLLGSTELTVAGPANHMEVATHANLLDGARRRLLHLIDDALLLSSIQVGSNEVVHSFVSLEEVIADAVKDVAEAEGAPHAAITVRPGDVAQVAGGRRFLSKALSYLILIALRFSKADGALIVGWQVVSSEAWVEIVANGRSVAPEYLPRFFDAPVMGEPIAADDDLRIAALVAAQMIRLQGGSVTVANRDPSGLCLSVVLPLERSPKSIKKQ